MSKLTKRAHVAYSVLLTGIFASAIMDSKLKWSGDEIGIEPHGDLKPHSQEMLEACPSLRTDAVETKVARHNLNFRPEDWDQHENISGISTISADDVTENILFDEDIEDPNPHLLYISSPGGEVHASHQIIDAMNIARKPTFTLCANHISSAAMTVFAHGDTRIAMESCKGIAHATFQTQTLLDRLLEQIFSSEHHLKEEQTHFHNQNVRTREIFKNAHMDDTCYNFLQSADNGDTYLNSMDFLRLGIADGIITSSNEIIIRAEDEEKLAGKLTPTTPEL